MLLSNPYLFSRIRNFWALRIWKSEKNCKTTQPIVHMCHLGRSTSLFISGTQLFLLYQFIFCDYILKIRKLHRDGHQTFVHMCSSLSLLLNELIRIFAKLVRFCTNDATYTERKDSLNLSKMFSNFKPKKMSYTSNNVILNLNNRFLDKKSHSILLWSEENNLYSNEHFLLDSWRVNVLHNFKKLFRLV